QCGWRSHRHRPSGGRLGRPHRAALPERAAPAQSAPGAGRHLHRRRPGRRHADRIAARSPIMTPVLTLELQNFTLYTDEQHIAWLKIDCAGSAVIRLSADVLQELARALDHLNGHPPNGLVIYSGKSAGFVAGADIDEFAELDNAEKGQALVTR